MSSVTTLSPFAQMPTVIQETIASCLPLEEVDSLSQVSKTFNKVFNSPVIWTKIAKQLNVPITAHPKQDVFAHYHRINHLILQDLDPTSTLIERNVNPLLQHRAIENYIKANGNDVERSLTDIEKNDEWHYETFKLAMTHLPLNLFDCLTPEYVIERGYSDVVQILINRGIAFMFFDIKHATMKGHFGLARLLIKAIDIPQNEFEDEMFILYICRRCSELVRDLIDKGFSPTQKLIDQAKAEGLNEIVAVLRDYRPRNDNNEDGEAQVNIPEIEYEPETVD